MYQGLLGSLKILAMPCPVSKLVKEKSVGRNMMACAKMMGITPEAFTFSGRNCLAPEN
jgi:hypothetical protein